MHRVRPAGQSTRPASAARGGAARAARWRSVTRFAVWLAVAAWLPPIGGLAGDLTGTVRTRQGASHAGKLHLAAGNRVRVEPAEGAPVVVSLAEIAVLRLDSSLTNPATILSINSQGLSTPMEPGEVAGVVRAAHWNNFSKAHAAGPLCDQQGRLSAVTYQFSGADFEDRVARLPDRPGDFRMMRGYSDQTEGMTHRLMGLPFARYDLYLYFDRADDNGCRSFNHKFWLTGAGGGILAGPVYAQDRHEAGFDGRFIEVPISSTNDHARTPAGNYFHFTGLTASVLSIMVGDGYSSWGEWGYSRSCLNGLQVVATAGPVAPGLAHGMVLRSGEAVAGTVRSADEHRVAFVADHGTEVSLPLETVARLIFAPVFPDLERNIPPGKAGSLSRGGEFMEAEFQSIHEGQLSLSSVLFGLRTLDLSQEVAAVVLAPVRPVAAPFRVKTREGGLVLAETLECDHDTLRVRGSRLGRLTFALAEVAEINATPN